MRTSNQAGDHSASRVRSSKQFDQLSHFNRCAIGIYMRSDSEVNPTRQRSTLWCQNKRTTRIRKVIPKKNETIVKIDENASKRSLHEVIQPCMIESWDRLF